MEEFSTLLAFPDDLRLFQIILIATTLTICVSAIQQQSACPLCSQASSQIHSHYERTLNDLPCGEREVRLRLSVRKFVCRNPICSRKIFTERFPYFVAPWARMTERFYQVVQSIGLATSGELGARLASRLGIKTSPTTIIRRVMDLPTPLPEPVPILGIDDWSFRRGRKFGTILVNLESHKVIDLLPDRKAQTASDWLSEHPEIEIVSRDRGGDYSCAAKSGAPQAIEVADRFHIVKNLSEAVEIFLARSRPQIRLATSTAQILTIEAGEPEKEKPVVSLEEWRPRPHPSTVKLSQARRAERLDRYEQAVELRAQGLDLAEIVRRVGVSERTIRNWLKHEVYPEIHHPKRQSIFDPYAAYVLKRWEQGIKDVAQIFLEITNQGYTGSARTVQRFLSRLYEKKVVVLREQIPEQPLQKFSAKNAVWLFMREHDALDSKEQEELAIIRQADISVDTIYQLVRNFLQMVHKREGHQLDEWLEKAETSGISELLRFACGIKRDKEAVLAGLTLPYNNGQVEGQVNKLKLIKRMMYGRAGFPLLRQRVLHAM